MKMSKDYGDLFPDLKSYQSLIGKLIYLTITRPDICFTVHKLAQYTSDLCVPYYQFGLNILQYIEGIKGIVGFGLIYLSYSTLELNIFTYADVGTCLRP